MLKFFRELFLFYRTRTLPMWKLAPPPTTRGNYSKLPVYTYIYIYIYTCCIWYIWYMYLEDIYIYVIHTLYLGDTNEWYMFIYSNIVNGRYTFVSIWLNTWHMLYMIQLKMYIVKCVYMWILNDIYIYSKRNNIYTYMYDIFVDWHMLYDGIHTYIRDKNAWMYAYIYIYMYVFMFDKYVIHTWYACDICTHIYMIYIHDILLIHYEYMYIHTYGYIVLIRQVYLLCMIYACPFNLWQTYDVHIIYLHKIYTKYTYPIYRIYIWYT